MPEEAYGYARISSDPRGQELGVERQRQDMERQAAALGWTMTGWYVDNDVTADPRKKPRPEFDRLLVDMAAGTVQRVLVYDQDRLVRDMRQLEDVVDAVEAGGVALTSVNGDIDLRSDNGRMVARIKAAVARNEIEKVSRRTARQKRQRAEAGLPMGTRYRLFGYDRQWQVIETEAEIVREVFRRVGGGESQNSVTRDLAERGVLTVAEKPWTALATSRLLKFRGYAGIQTFKGEVIGTTAYPALVDEPTYLAAQSVQDKAGFNTRVHFLSGVLTCGLCFSKMNGTAATEANKGGRYRCDKRGGGCGRVAVRADWMDAFIHRYMAHIAMFDTPTAEPADNSAERDAVQTEIDDTNAAMQAGTLALIDGIPLLQAQRARLAALVRADAERVVNAWKPIEDYDNADSSAQRAMLAGRVRNIIVKPGRRVRYFDVDRLVVIMADGRQVPGRALDVTDLRDAERPEV